MTTVISVRFKKVGKVYYFDPGALSIPSGASVIVETARGVEYGECMQGPHEVEEEKVVPPLRPVLRLATEEDERTLQQNEEKEKKAFDICVKKILDHRLEMKLVDVEYTFDGAKIIFYFTADGRVDFRELVKDLASVFRTRIELRQIGVRDEAKMLGGIGICGKPFCCATFLDEFQPVSIKMAKEQSLSLNPIKISGTCGRLMCCLKYEQEAYEDLLRRAPKPESRVETPEGPGVVVDVNLLRARVKVRLDDAPEALKVFAQTDCCAHRKHRGSAAGSACGGGHCPGCRTPEEEELMRAAAPKPAEQPWGKSLSFAHAKSENAMDEENGSTTPRQQRGGRSDAAEDAQGRGGRGRGPRNRRDNADGESQPRMKSTESGGKGNGGTTARSNNGQAPGARNAAGALAQNPRPAPRGPRDAGGRPNRPPRPTNGDTAPARTGAPASDAPADQNRRFGPRPKPNAPRPGGNAQRDGADRRAEAGNKSRPPRASAPGDTPRTNDARPRPAAPRDAASPSGEGKPRGDRPPWRRGRNSRPQQGQGRGPENTGPSDRT